MITRRFAALALAAALGACGAPEPAPDGETGNASTAEDAAMSEWTDLTDLSAWRGYGRQDLPGGWQEQDAAIAFVPGVEGGDIVTRQQFDDFELELEWRVGPAGNSGIFYRGLETDEPIYNTAPEMQILDDAGHNDGRSPMTSAGSLYALYPVPDGVVRPAGEWNQARIVARGPHVEHWLNGQKVVEAEIGSEDWNRRVAESKFAELADFGRAARGHIGLQDHGDPVWFRNIRVRSLDADAGAP